MNVKCIFFDFDGVLAESVHVKTEAFRQMYLHHGEDFANRVVAHHNQNGGVSRFEKFKVYNGQWLGEKVGEEEIATLAGQFSELVVDGVVNADEVTGARELLESSGHIRKFIITGTPTVEIVPILERREMLHFFDGTYGSPEKKGYWVSKILKEENIQPKDCLFIGDARADYQAAQDNDVKFVLRETPEGMEIFKDFRGARVKDMTELKNMIS